MTLEREASYLQSLLDELRGIRIEVEWLEFKVNNSNPDEIGEYISALANSAALWEKTSSYMVWGVVDDESKEILGTDFNPKTQKIGNQELESWLIQHLSPRVHFIFHSFVYNEKPIIILEIPLAVNTPVQFKNQTFIRVGSYKKKLKDFPEKERELWKIFDRTPFEMQIAAENLSPGDVLNLIDYPSYFTLLNFHLPENRERILEYLEKEKILQKNTSGNWNITNMGAILFANNLDKFPSLKRKAIRVIFYNGINRMETIQENTDNKGYASGFQNLISFINSKLPANEVLGEALRHTARMFPELAIRELIANAIIHQDFSLTGTSPMVEIFSNRIEITNPGKPLVDPDRFLDSPPRSRNERIASLLRRIGICEERGTGIDKVISSTEMFQLPAPLFEVPGDNTRVVLFAHKSFADMDKDERIRACYMHTCLKYVQREFMTNYSLRQRFSIQEKNSAVASRIIRDTLAKKLIKPYDEDAAKKQLKYVPHWA
ncbi:MAG: putative DNA binding domain-containing protein [Leptospiraceae bacterium]|nr:putative DNA binding domain-containing protein [Leptospiraceae bacterium]